jgi:hypothetical protein
MFAMFAEATLRVERFAVPATLSDEATFNVVKLEVPETLRLVRTPTDVTLGCEGLVTTPATLAAATFPTRFEELRFERPEALPVYRRAVTVTRFDPS